jgi:hypothetical protein
MFKEHQEVFESTPSVLAFRTAMSAETTHTIHFCLKIIPFEVFAERAMKN